MPHLPFPSFSAAFRLVHVALAFSLATGAQAAEFQAFTAQTIANTYPYTLSSPVIRVTAISGDGKTIGGSITQTGVIFDCASFDCATTGFVWSVDRQERVPIPTLPDPSWHIPLQPNSVEALTYDGRTALVTSVFRLYESALHSSESVRALRELVPNGEWLLASDMTPNADTVVGSLGTAPFIWIDATGLQPLSGIDADSGYGPRAISADGRVVVLNDHSTGSLNIPLPATAPSQNPLRWTASGGPQELGALAGSTRLWVNAISGDGVVTVGWSQLGDSLETRATVWSGLSPTLLPLLGQNNASTAIDVSHDGRTIVGEMSSPIDPSPIDPPPATSKIIFELPATTTSQAVIWRDGQAFDLMSLLATEYGLGSQLQGWTLSTATAVSDNGLVIAGTGFAPDGSQGLWVANLAVPEPSSLLIVALLGAPLCGRWLARRGDSARIPPCLAHARS